MKIALAQLNFLIGDFASNTQKIILNIEQAKREGADLVIFPELSVCGYYPYDLLERKEFLDWTKSSINEIAEACTGIAAIIGAPTVNKDQKGKELYNSALFIENGAIKATVNKTVVPSYGIFDEYKYFEANTKFNVINFKGHKLGITICEDLWGNQPKANSQGSLDTPSPIEELSKQKPDLIINLSASPFAYNHEVNRKDTISRKAKQYMLPIVHVNQVGAQTEVIFDGGSFFVNEKGEIEQELHYFEEDFRVIDLDNRPEKMVQKSKSNIGKIHDALILGIRDYFSKMGFTNATLGLSGGIDSAVVAALAVEALGAENVRVLLLPSKYSSDHSLTDAIDLAQNLGIKYETVQIQPMVDEFESALAPIFRRMPQNVTEENIQARTRGVLLMAISNKFGNILLNTTNKSECAVGYGTLYGDMNGSLSILGDLYKTDVYKLANYINRKKTIIPENSINKAPSAELRPDQKDSDSLPDYDILDDILYRYIELNRTPSEIIYEGFDEDIVQRVVRLVNATEYKRFQAPPILRVSSKAFGCGRKMPLVSKYQG